MTELTRVPLKSGEYIVAEVDRLDIPDSDVVLAAPEPGKAMAQMPSTLETGLRAIRPAVAELARALKASGPDSLSIEFGVKIGGETGVILAKGTAEVNFKVIMAWKPSSDEQPAEGS